MDRSYSTVLAPGNAERDHRTGSFPQPHFTTTARSSAAECQSRVGDPTLLLSCYFLRTIALEGVGTFLSGLAGAMSGAGWHVQLLSPGGPIVDRRRIDERTYRPGTLGMIRYASSLRELSQVADVVLAIDDNPNMGSLAGVSRCPQRTFSYFNTPLESLATLAEMGWSRQAFAHTLAKHPWFSRRKDWSQRRCIVASRYQADQLQELGAAEIHVLPGGGLSSAGSVLSRAEARRQMGWDDRPVVGYLGHYSPAKGVPVLIDAFTRGTGPAVLALAYSGKGRLPRKADYQLATLRQAGRVRELGIVNPVHFLAACDVVVLPFVTSSIHHLPLVMLESFAAGTPVIVSRVGGVAEMITPGMHGDVVAPRDPQVLADAMQRHLADQDACHAMGRHARRLFENELSNEVFCARLSDIIRKERA